MRLEIFIFGLTAFFIFNAYKDGKYTKMLLSFKKYYSMCFYAMLGVGIWVLLKKNPTNAHNLLLHANNVIKSLPIDKSSSNLLSPIIDFTNINSSSFMENINHIEPVANHTNISNSMNTNTKHKRVVSETKKKFVAYQQNWKCNHCQCQLDHTFEIDHKIRLEYGGDNEVTNLVALCRNCHGKKTARENM
jgi:hypothetical protein